MLDGAVLALLAAGLGVGVLTGLTPVLPAEAYVLAVALMHDRGLAVAVAVAVAVGQTVGKTVVFSAVRGAGRSRWLDRVRARSRAAVAARAGARQEPGAPAGTSRWRRAVVGVRSWLARAGDLCLAALSGRAGWAVVLLSAAVGLPPLAAVSFIAGASSMRRGTFVVACLLGRSALFVAIAAAPHALSSVVGG